MSGLPPQPNTRPYGTPYSGPPVDAASTEGVALRRAMDKLAMVRGGFAGDAAAGLDTTAVVTASVLAAIPVLLFGAIGIALIVNDGSLVGGLIFLMLTLAAAAIPLLVAKGSRPDRPERALKAFYRAIGRGKSQRAARLVTNADMDTVPRVQPLIQNLGQPTGHGYVFQDPNQFALYWNALVRSHPMPYCIVRVSGVKVHHPAPDIAVVDYKLRLTMNTQLWLFLVLVALLIAIIVDVATRKVVTVQLRKVLVKVGDEWNLLNGEWQGYEDYDLRWVDCAQE